jgi:hypothetical protein
MEKVSWIDHVRNEKVLLRVNEHRNILHEIRRLDWSHLTQKLPSKASYQRKYKGRDESDKKMRKKT